MSTSSPTRTPAPGQHREPPDPRQQPVERRRRSLWSPVSILLILLMAVGSAAMWIGVPLGLVWLVSSMVDTPNPGFGPYLVILIGLPAGMVVIGKLLGMLDRVHGRYTGLLQDGPNQAVWLRSMRDDRRRKRSRSVLDPVMVVSVLLCLGALGFWFIAFAGSPLPS